MSCALGLELGLTYVWEPLPLIVFLPPLEGTSGNPVPQVPPIQSGDVLMCTRGSTLFDEYYLFDRI